jgi:hypothetical protein
MSCRIVDCEQNASFHLEEHGYDFRRLPLCGASWETEISHEIRNESQFEDVPEAT